MSRTLVRSYVARKPHRCDNCRAKIEPGTKYFKHALPPHAEPFYSPRWSVLITCGLYVSDCIDYWEIDAKTLAGEDFINP